MKKLIILSAILFTSLIAVSQEVIFLNEATFKAKVWNYDQNSQWKFIGDKPMIIDFYADWCKPCKMVAPFLTEIQSEYGNKLQVYKINTDNNPGLANLFKVRSIPTLLFVPADGNYKEIVGYRDKAQLTELVENVLKVTK
jgi:thioredoxin 1